MKKKTKHKTIKFESLSNSDLFLDGIYEGGGQKNLRAEALSKLIGCGNAGGFRPFKKLCVLFSDMKNPDWPDSIDFESGKFVYYGDNKTPGKEIHEMKGNKILRKAFDDLHNKNRENIPPFFIFTRGPKGHDVIFRGLAVPGARDVSQTEDLIGLWKTKNSNRFMNYKATFTILKTPLVKRLWINDLREGKTLQSAYAPKEWVSWVKQEKYLPLQAPKVKVTRNKEEQLPQDKLQQQILQEITSYFKGDPYAFEKCAAEIFSLMEPHKVIEIDLTRPWRDGGRDALGKYRIGDDRDSNITVEFALEAKCGYLNRGNTVKDMSRLISRLLHRQFGVFVTTSYVADQAYKEVIEDGHPVIIISGKDICLTLMANDLNSRTKIRQWLKGNFQRIAG